jgi:hypothetical protein
MRSLVSLASLAVAAQPELYPKLSTLPVSVQAQLLRHLVKFAEGLSPSIFSFCDSTTLHLDSNLCNDEVVNALADAPLKTEILALEKADYCERGKERKKRQHTHTPLVFQHWLLVGDLR